MMASMSFTSPEKFSSGIMKHSLILFSLDQDCVEPLIEEDETLGNNIPDIQSTWCNKQNLVLFGLSDAVSFDDSLLLKTYNYTTNQLMYFFQLTRGVIMTWSWLLSKKKKLLMIRWRMAQAGLCAQELWALTKTLCWELWILSFPKHLDHLSLPSESKYINFFIVIVFLVWSWQLSNWIQTEKQLQSLSLCVDPVGVGLSRKWAQIWNQGSINTLPIISACIDELPFQLAMVK